MVPVLVTVLWLPLPVSVIIEMDTLLVRFSPGSVGVKVLQSNPVVPFPNPVPVGEKVPGQLLVLHLSFHLHKISACILTKLLRLPPRVCVVPRLRVVHVGEEATKVKVFKANLREILPIGVDVSWARARHWRGGFVGGILAKD